MIGGRGGERGFALLVVLWVIVLLGVLSGEVVTASRFDAATTFNERCRIVGHYAARAGVADAREQLRALVTPGADGRPDGFLALAGIPQEEPGRLATIAGALPDARYRVEVLDLGARVNVNRLDGPGLRALFEAAGVGADRAAPLADAVLDWIDADDLRRAQGAEADAYGVGGRGPRNGPVPALDELLAVRGMTPELLYGPTGRPTPKGAGLDRYLAVEGSGRVNLNTAPAAVLAALPGFAPDVVALVLDRRRAAPLGSLSEIAADPRLAGGPLRLQDFAMALLATTTTRSEEARVRSMGLASGCAVAGGVDAVVGVTAEGPTVQSWREWMAPAPAAGEAGR